MDTQFPYMDAIAVIHSDQYLCHMNLPLKAGDKGTGKKMEAFDIFAGHHICADIPALYPMPTAGAILTQVVDLL